MDFILAHKVEILSTLAVFEQILPIVSWIPGNSTIEMILEIVKKVVSSLKKPE